MVAAEEDTSETAHSSAEDEPADDDLDEAPESHHYSCGLEVRCVCALCGTACAWCCVCALCGAACACCVNGPDASAWSRSWSRDVARPWPLTLVLASP